MWAACYSGKRTRVRSHTAWVQVPFLPLWSSVAFEQGHLLKFFWASFSQSLKWEGWLRWLWRSFWLWYSSSMKKVTTTSCREWELIYIQNLFQSSSRKVLQTRRVKKRYISRRQNSAVQGPVRPLRSCGLAHITSAPQRHQTERIHITETAKFYLFLFL